MIVDPGLDEAYLLAADEVSFEELELGATIYVEEDYSLEAAPRELRDEYEAAQLSGDKDRVEAILTELWEEYGIDTEKDPDQRATGGIRKLVVTDDHFAHVVRQRYALQAARRSSSSTASSRADRASARARSIGHSSGPQGLGLFSCQSRPRTRGL